MTYIRRDTGERVKVVGQRGAPGGCVFVRNLAGGMQYVQRWSNLIEEG